MGKFIVIESSDAAGGSTQTSLLVKRLKKNKYKPHQFHFPQEDAPTGQMIYSKFLRANNKAKLTKREQALLYIQDFFAQSATFEKILQGKKNVIVSDRYCTSTMAYQTAGMTGNTRRRMLKWITWLVWQGEPQLPKPDLVIFIDLPVDISLERLKGTKTDFHERRSMLERFRRSYLKLAHEQKWAVVSGVSESGEPRSRKNVHEEIWQKAKEAIS